MQFTLFDNQAQLPIDDKQHYPQWDKDKKYPFAFHQYFANSESRTLLHANSLFMNYNCTAEDLTELGDRVICNSGQDIQDAFDALCGRRKKTFIILCPYSQVAEKFYKN